MNKHLQSKQHVTATFQTLVDALLPTADQVGSEATYHPTDLGVHEYLMDGFNHYISIQKQLKHQVVPLAKPIACMLDEAAEQLVYAKVVQISNHSSFPDGGMFSYLSREDRIRILSALEETRIDLYLMPAPFQNNAGMIKFVVDALNRFALFGYYSEWPGYGSTRLNPPDYRVLEYFPPGWKKVGYPGVALGYRDFRGILFTMAEVK